MSPLSRMNSLDLPSRMELAEVLEWFEKCFDHIENVRLFPDRAREADPAPHDWTGPIDRYGRPIRTKEEIAIATATRKLIDESEGRDKRVLLWSRLGFDRPCVLAAAYLVRRWGLSAESAVEYVKKGRKGTKISDYYMSALTAYSELHSIGELLCQDCLCFQTVPLVTVVTPGETETAEKKNEGYRLVLPTNAAQETISLRIQGAVASAPETLRCKLGIQPFNHFYCHRPYPAQALAVPSLSTDFTVLIDVKISGKLLCDEETKAMVGIFKAAGILRQLHLIDLSDNLISCDGVVALCEALDEEQSPELAILLLRNNRVGPRGAVGLTRLLEPKFSLHTLSLANNQIGDAGGFAIAHALILPEKDLFADEEYKDPDAATNASLYSRPNSDHNKAQSHRSKKAEDEEYLIKNATLTSLDLSNNALGKETLEALAAMIKSNLTLHTLHLDCLDTASRGGTYLNHIFDECRAFNKTLRRLSLTDSTLTVNTFDHLMRVFDGSSPLQRVNLSRCNITALHLRKSVIKATLSNHLTHIILSGNKLSDQGIGFITDLFLPTARGGPPLRSLDISTCDMTIASAIPLLRAISSKDTMASVDISDNNLHGTIAQMKELSSALAASSLQHLNLSRCRLGVNGSCSLFSSLLVNASLKVLILAENEIKDSVDEPLSEYLRANTSLEVLDLGYNCLTSGGVRKSRGALAVQSNSSLERKVTELHINLIGNPCGPYELEYPGMARSKTLLRYGQERLDGEEFLFHISGSSSEDYWQRRKRMGEISTDTWSNINFIS
jgi:Ran GTPase-activating protein (RanGAP) involved in mRNA processing and transport